MRTPLGQSPTFVASTQHVGPNNVSSYRRVIVKELLERSVIRCPWTICPEGVLNVHKDRVSIDLPLVHLDFKLLRSKRHHLGIEVLSVMVSGARG